MSAEGPGVSRRWLALREPADAAARARDLVDCLKRQGTDHWIIHDLGCGTGAMGRWLAPLLAGPQHWVAHDRDEDLLAVAVADVLDPAADGSAVTVEARRSDIHRLRPNDLAGATLITASALLDMLAEDELDRIVTVCASAGCPVLMTLTVSGHVDLIPPEPLDQRLAAAFNAHQRRATGRGRLLGPDAAAFAVERFSRLGAEVLIRDSPWRLDASRGDLLVAWLNGWVRAACEQQVELTPDSDVYAERRLEQAKAGRLAAIVGHADLLALPH